MIKGMACPYCGQSKENLSDGHVVPRAVGGGGLRPINPFLDRYVDGLFVRKWFIHNERVMAGQAYYDPSITEPIVPYSCPERSSAVVT